VYADQAQLVNGKWSVLNGKYEVVLIKIFTKKERTPTKPASFQLLLYGNL